MSVCRRVLPSAVLILCSLAPAPAGAQGPSSARLLQIEDARELSVESQAALVAGTKDSSPRIRAQAVRAMGRFESPALIGQIVPLLSDADAGVRQAAAVATASSAKVFPGQAIEALTAAMSKAAPADWAVFAASLGRISLPDEEQFSAAERIIAAGLPAAAATRRGRGTTRPTVRSADAVRIEGAARGLEALVRVNGKLGTLSAGTRSRLAAVVQTQQGPAADASRRARRLALLALRTDKAVDGPLLLAATKDGDDEVRRLAMTAAAAPAAPDGSPIPDADRVAALRAGLKDTEPRVRIDALRGWGRHQQARDCQPVVAAAADAITHVAVQALDLLGGGCPEATAAPGVAGVLRKEAEALPRDGATWHRAVHAMVSLARVAPGDARELLPRFLAHPTWQVRMYAARAAGRMSAIDPLVELGADAHDNVRQAALDELMRLKHDEALAVAYDALARPDFQLQMTAARALAAETDKPKAAAALFTALEALTAQGHDTSRDPRVAMARTLAEVGAAADASRLEPYLEDWDARVAEEAAKAIAQWTGTAREASPKRRQQAAPDAAAAEALRDRWLRITMAGGGVMDLRLLVDDAAATVLRVTGLARNGYYSGLTFHRVAPTFVLQGGSPGANEFMGDGLFMRDEPGVAHHRGTVGISTRGRDTGDAQIFVNLVDSPRLDHIYTVFAVVERGMDVADRVLEGDVMARVELVDAPRR